MSNFSEADENPFGDSNFENNTEYESTKILRQVMMYFNLITFIADFFICLANISAAIFLIVIILRHQKLKTRTNMYLMHFSLNTVLYYVVSFVCHIIITLSGAYNMRGLSCSVNNFDTAFLSMLLIFATLLALDWYIINIKTSLLEKYVKFSKYIYATVYSIGASKFIIGLIICFTTKRYYLFPYSMYLVYILCLVSVNIINILKYKNEKVGESYDNPAKYILIVANVIIHSWLLLCLYTFIESHTFSTGFYSSFIAYLLVFTNWIAYWAANGHVILVVYLLGRLNTDFKMAFKMAFKRKFRKYDHNDLDQSDGESSIHHKTDTDFVEVNY